MQIIHVKCSLHVINTNNANIRNYSIQIQVQSILGNI